MTYLMINFGSITFIVGKLFYHKEH